MMTDVVPFPLLSNPVWLLAAFFMLLAFFHFILVGRLSRRGWKRVDYIWLGVAAVGLVTAAAEVRQFLAASLSPPAHYYRLAAYDRMLDAAAYLSSDAICRDFARSLDSPSNFDQLQSEFDVVCQYGQDLGATLEPEPPAAGALSLPGQPSVTAGGLRDFLGTFNSALNDFRQANQRYDELLAASRQGTVENIVLFFSPLLLAVALALRITKVTGDIRLDREN